MRDRETEAQYYPREFLPLQDLDDLLCIAPHPDDEVFGAGGLLALLAAQGRRVRCLVLSRGERAEGDPSGELAALRMDESRRAARELGLPEPRFLEWPDRGMVYGEPLIADIAAQISETGARVLLLPALSEPHPDHQVAALAGMAAAQRSATVRTLLFYEVGAPMHPNALVDVSGVAERKWRAMREFASQEAIQPYEAQARALATLRAFGAPGGCVAAEAFFRVEVDALRSRGAGAALPTWPLARARGQLANGPDELPLVSVLVRSMDRPQLSEAIASVAAQTWPNLEVVVLNASGRAHSPLLAAPAGMPLRLVQPGLDEGAPPRPCDRAVAANLALQAARGEFALFLDDDDLIHPGHLERLVAGLRARPAAVAAYAGVRVEGPDGAFLRDYDLPWSPERLQGINFLPMHAVLFRLAPVRASGLRFDESLPVLEDWQFWRELAALGGFVHCPGVSALYRQAHGDSGVGTPGHPNHWQRWHRLLLERGLEGAAPQRVADLLAWHAIEVDRLQAREERLQAREEWLQAQHDERGEALEQLRRSSAAELDALQAAQGELERDRALLRSEIAMMTTSRSWRLTRPLRALAGWLRRLRGRA